MKRVKRSSGHRKEDGTGRVESERERILIGKMDEEKRERMSRGYEE